MSDQDDTKKVEVLLPYKPNSAPPATTADTPPGRSMWSEALHRMGLRQTKLTIEAETDVIGAKADYVKATTGLGGAVYDNQRMTGRAGDIASALKKDQLGRDNELLKAQIENKDLQRDLRERQSATSTSSDAPSEPSNEQPADAFAEQLKAEFALSPAQKIHGECEKAIRELLGGIPEDQASAQLKEIIANLRAKAETMAKDVGA